MDEKQIQMIDDLLTDCERSIRYHQARAEFYNAMHLRIQFIMFIVTAASATCLYQNIFDDIAASTAAVLAIASVLAFFSLVWNPSEKNGLHISLQRSFTTHAATISAATDVDDKMCAKWTREIQLLYAQAPSLYRALNAHCYNQVSLALGVEGRGYFIDLRWHHRWLRNLFSFQGTNFQIRKEKTKVRAKAKRKSVKA